MGNIFLIETLERRGGVAEILVVGIAYWKVRICYLEELCGKYIVVTG